MSEPIKGPSTADSSEPAQGEEESLEDLKVKARELTIPGSENMDRDELLHQILKHQGGDGGLSI